MLYGKLISQSFHIEVHAGDRNHFCVELFLH